MADTGPTSIDCKGVPALPGGEYKLDGCLLMYGGGCQGGLKLPEEGHVLAPWVALTFEGSGSVITVGNDSSPNTSPENSAIIKSFEFGYTDGLTMRCTIHDEQGGSFVRFMEHLVKDYICLKKGSPAAVRIKIQFGWAKTECPDPLPVVASRCYYCLGDSIETSYTEGKFICEITGKDLMFRAQEGSTNQLYGGEGDKGMFLRDAIVEYMTNKEKSCPPNVGSVKFMKMEGGKPSVCNFQNGGEKGIKGKWIANGQDKLKVVLNWLKSNPAEGNKGWIPTYNSEVPEGGELIFWRDSKPTSAQPSSYWDDNCLGTYIVNGGLRSSVIEFNPKIRWDFSRLTNQGGQMSGEQFNPTKEPGATLPGQKQIDLDAKGHPCTGHNTQATGNDTHKDVFGKSQTQQVIFGVNAAHRAMRILHDQIEADLVVVGDPTILPPSEAMWAKNVTIIVVNPYYIRRSESDDELDWLASPTCNEVLSSKAWVCKSITHKIESGKYTTTIGVYMVAPGSDISPKSPVGAWTGGWVPYQCV